MKRTTKQPEHRNHRSAEFRLSAGDKGPVIGGYAAVFDQPSLDMGWTEEVDPHAFDSVIAGNPDVRCLFNHDSDQLLGRTTSGTLRLSVDSRGLAYECDLPDTQLGRDIGVLIERKDINGSSFGFICKRDQWTENTDGSVTRRILEFDELFDVSPVTFPAYTQTSAGKRSLPTSMPTEFRSRFEKRDLFCSCECPECMAGDCINCSNADCQDPNCEGSNIDEFYSERSRMEMELQLASLPRR